MARADQRLNCGFLIVTVLWSLAIAALGAHQVLLFMVPALLLALPLALGRYLGEESLGRLRERIAAPRPRRVPASGRAPRPHAALALPRGGALIAFGLATRPPPAPALT